MKRSRQVAFITVAAVITSSPRWVGSLLASEGFVIPNGWLDTWIVVSAIAAFCMAIVESWAFAFIFDAWRREKDKRLLALAIGAALVFVVVLSPFVVAQAKSSEVLASVLVNDMALWLWGVAVASSTIVIVAGVGYSQKEAEDTATITTEQWESLQTYAENLTAELTQAQEALEQASADTERADRLQAWIDTLHSFDTSTKQGAVAMIAFAKNGNTPTQRQLAIALDVSESTVRLGEAIAREAQQ
jgi:hypothetical protein